MSTNNNITAVIAIDSSDDERGQNQQGKGSRTPPDTTTTTTTSTRTSSHTSAPPRASRTISTTSVTGVKNKVPVSPPTPAANTVTPATADENLGDNSVLVPPEKVVTMRSINICTRLIIKFIHMKKEERPNFKHDLFTHFYHCISREQRLHDPKNGWYRKEDKGLHYCCALVPKNASDEIIEEQKIHRCDESVVKFVFDICKRVNKDAFQQIDKGLLDEFDHLLIRAISESAKGSGGIDYDSLVGNENIPKRKRQKPNQFTPPAEAKVQKKPRKKIRKQLNHALLESSSSHVSLPVPFDGSSHGVAVARGKSSFFESPQNFTGGQFNPYSDQNEGDGGGEEKEELEKEELKLEEIKHKLHTSERKLEASRKDAKEANAKSKILSQKVEEATLKKDLLASKVETQKTQLKTLTTQKSTLERKRTAEVDALTSKLEEAKSQIEYWKKARKVEYMFLSKIDDTANTNDKWTTDELKNVLSLLSDRLKLLKRRPQTDQKMSKNQIIADLIMRVSSNGAGDVPRDYILGAITDTNQELENLEQELVTTSEAEATHAP